MRTHTIKNTEAVASGIILRCRLSLELESRFRDEYRAAEEAQGSKPDLFTAQLLLLTAYAVGWYGPWFQGKFSEQALLSYDVPDGIDLLTSAMDWCYSTYTAQRNPPTQPTSDPATDQYFDAMVDRWRRKFAGEKIVAGHNDRVVSLMARLGWTEKQTLEDNSPDILEELSAYFEGKYQYEESMRKGGSSSVHSRKRGFSSKAQRVNMWDRYREIAEKGGVNG